MADRLLIPGLPDDMAMECFIRVPYQQFPAMQEVCKRWKRALNSPYFHQLRKSRNKTEDLIVLLQAQPSPVDHSSANTKNNNNRETITSYQLSLYQPKTNTWTLLPSIPELEHGFPLFSQLAAVGEKLVLIGGWDPHTFAVSNSVYIFDFRTGRWRRGSPMPRPPRSFFTCAAMGPPWPASVIVAGGHDENKEALKSTLMYDVDNDAWTVMPDMVRVRDEPKAVVVNGRVHVAGGYPTEFQGQFSRSGELLDFETWNWVLVDNMLADATCPRACTGGFEGKKLYICAGRSVMVLDNDNGVWKKLTELPEHMRSASQLIASNVGELTALGTLLDGTNGAYKLDMGKMTWHKLDLPMEFSGAVHAWSSLEI